MGYPTDVREYCEEYKRGIDANFAGSGTILGTGETWLKANADKAGKIASCRLVSTHLDIGLRIYVDGYQVNRGYQDTPHAFFDTYGCCGQSQLMKLSRYDTVNDKYVLELAHDLEFGNRFDLKLNNPTGSSQNCYADIVWIENM